MTSEYSCGGLVHKGDKVLLVKVRNLKREYVWTFPKGHVEAGETPRQTALREVREETGYQCAVSAPLMTVRYFFVRDGKKVAKKVKWYLMEPERRVGVPDAEEVYATKWARAESAPKILTYPSDKKLLHCFVSKELKKNRVIVPIRSPSFDSRSESKLTRPRRVKAAV